MNEKQMKKYHYNIMEIVLTKNELLIISDIFDIIDTIVHY